MKKPNKKQRRELIRIVEYMVSGGAYFWSGYLVFYVLYDVIDYKNLWWVNLASNVTGWTVNYLLQRYWVFKNPNSKVDTLQVTSRYIFLTLVNFGLDFLIIAGLQKVGLTPYISKFISAGLFTVWNYLWYKYWVFPISKTKAKTPRLRSKRA